MKIVKVIIILVFVSSVTKSSGQNFELGKVSTKELLEKFHAEDSTAVAAILFKKARTFFSYNSISGFTVNHEYIYRIKIYKKEGLSWANFEVPYYIGYEEMKDESVKFSNCVTYNLENGNIVKTKLNSEGNFKKNMNEYWREASITMPNVKVGSVIEFKYILKSEGIVKFPAFKIQYDIPVNYAEYITEIPEYFIYKPILTGYLKVKVEAKYVSGFQNFENKYNQSAAISYTQINSDYIAENIPALKEEGYIDNIENYRSSIYNELERTHFPEQPIKDYSITWEGVAKTIFENKSFGKELNEQLFLVPDIKTILKNVVSEDEKLDVIFKFIQNKMNWNKEYGYYTDKGVKKAYADRAGNVAEINFILIAMLKLAGINVNPVLISTIEHGVPIFPNRTVFNYVIAAAEIDGKQILLDATHKYTTKNILPFNTLNWTGRLIKQDGTSQEINLVPKLPSKVNYTLMTKIDGLGQITGKLRVQNTNYEAYCFREKNAQINKENYLEKLENDLDGIQISNYEIENKDTDFSKPVLETFTFTSDNHCERIGNRMFVNPMLFFALTKNPFLQEKRKMPIYFGYPKQDKYNINIEIPEGYTVESIPKAMKIATEDKIVLFTINTQVEGNRIQIIITREINAAILPADYYYDLKEFFQKIIDKQNEKIVLKKL
jgi:transglutaminase-like putative cysteine protease